MISSIKSCAAAVSLLLTPVVAGASVTCYHIGNSLTWDCKLTSMPQVFANEGIDYEQGYHIDCSMSLTRIVAYPDKKLCVLPPEPYGPWNHALKSYEWDYVTLEGYPAYATGDSEVSASITLINEALSEGRNSNCVFCLYFAWPQTNQAPSYAESINRPYTNGADHVVMCTDFADFWYSSVTQAFPKLDIRLIPTGHILEAMDQKLREINIGDFSEAYDLYRDRDHMGWETGRYISHAAMLTALLGKPPEQIAFPADDPEAFINQVDPELVELSNEVMWSAFVQDKRTGMEDQPTLSIRTNKTGGLEVSFVGELMISPDLECWSVTNVISPYRMPPLPTQPVRFYRAACSED
jgi:hypothetical protein